MRNTGSLIGNTMAVVWAAVALNAAQAPTLCLLGPVLCSALLFTLTRNIDVQPPDPAGRRNRRRVVMLSTLAEAVAILVGMPVLGWIGHSDLWACLLAVAVGLHFIPMAKWMPEPRFYLAAAGMLLAASIGAALPNPTRNILVGALGAAALWASCVLVLISTSRPKTHAQAS
jgi:hypothetical protein